MANSQTFTLNIKALFDASDVKAKVGDIQNAFKNIKLPNDLQKNFDSSLSNLTKALNDFESRATKGVSSKADAKGITVSIDNVIKEFSKVEEVVAKIKTEFNSSTDLSKIVQLDDATLQKIRTLKQDIQGLQQQLSDITSSKLNEVGQALDKIKSKGAKSGAQAAINLFNEGNIDAALEKLKEVEAKQRQLAESKKQDGTFSYGEATRKTAEENLRAIELLRQAFQSAQTEASGVTEQINNKVREIGTTTNNAAQEIVNGANNSSNALLQVGNSASQSRDQIVDMANSSAQMVREIDQVKSRIQYFFGISNAINLIKRAIRGAVDTVKELDKAMTETAVVTSNTISDMWKKLPDYTKRANELGVSTLEAYQAATLYYQQGLNDDQAAALSVETLKMARIAGLEAADATDRMTNALRGFNMELNEASARKVDDVYSQLAAMSASNVDEISTAMTKVASLAHSANMEFETTAAFLAQIIETTRESAETAGTALKTVVARFSEVKKLYDMDELKGQDEEGQTVDVNKVSSALRTAGIDLNKYFLGEVGLDDIFMELASKWDSLTSVQQRYIATQAAGSRQQSRFIALMQDYARTQQLVSAAYNANGASAKQFEKTQESLQSKLARLKNAWDQFLMGLANNSIIKGVVDLLTGLLNVVNNLTEVFGTGVGSILKWVAAFSAFAGVKQLFAGGGLVEKGLTALVGNTVIGNALQKAGIIGQAPIVNPYQGPPTANGKGPAPTIIGNIGNLASAGWGAAQKLGNRVATTGLGYKLGMSTEAIGSSGIATSDLSATAAGLTGVVTALGAVAAAVGVVVAAYTAWLELTPEGQLKQANQIADAMNKVASNAQKTASSYKNVQKSYQEYSDAVESSSSIAERQTAIQNRNDYITQLLESDPAYAEYISSMTDESGQFILTLDESALAAAVDKISDSAVKTAIASQMAQANVNTKQAQVYAARAANIQYRLNMAESRGSDTTQLKAELAQYQSQMASLNQSAQNQISAFVHQMLAGSNLDSELTNKLAEAYTKVYDSNAYQKTFDKYNLNAFSRLFGQGARKQEYESIFGVGSAKGLDRKEIADALAGYRIENEQQTRLDAVSQLVKSGGYDQILDAIAGNIDFDDFDGAADKIQKFAAAMGTSIDEVEQQIKQSQAARKELKKTNQANIFEQALRSGRNINETFANTIKGLDFDQLNIVSDIINQAAGKVSEQTFQSLFDTLPEMSDESRQEIQSFFNNFNLDNPITALEQLNNKIEEVGANSSFGKLLTDIKETNTALFESSNLVQSFLLSDSYDQLSDSIEEVTKNNKKLNGKNIEDMAESCHELDALLKEINEDLGENTDSAQALAEAINLIGEGSLAIDQITDSLLAALGAGESFESLIGNVQQWIEDFDKGTDLKTGTEHITSTLDDLFKYVDNWEFGNEPTENIYNHIFGTDKNKDPYKDLINQYDTNFTGLENAIKGDIERVKGWAENEGLGGIQEALRKNVTGLSQIEGENGLFFDWNLEDFGSTSEAINQVASALGIGQEAAEAFIMSWQTHMPKLRTEWNNLNLKEQINAFVNDLGSASIVTQQEIDAMAASSGKSAQEIINQINAAREAAGKPIIVTVNWQDENGGNLAGQDLIDKFKEQFSSGTANGGFTSVLTGTIKSIVDGSTTVDWDLLNQKLVNEFKLSPSQAADVANDIISEIDGNFSKEIKIPVITEIKDEDGKTIGHEITFETKVIEADTGEELQKKVELETDAADYAVISEKLAEVSVDQLGSNISTTMETGGNAGCAAIASAIESYPWPKVTIDVEYNETNTPLYGLHMAHGGLVKSYAKGSENFHVGAGTALTGEEGPELVWNKNDGYAYVTGQDGPEFADLHPGDRVFNASETKRIFANSRANGGLVDSFASGGWKDPAASKKFGGGSGSGSGSGGKDKTPEEWKNDLDWLYNLMEDIAELERDQKAIEEQYEDLLQDQTKTGGDLYRLLVKQLGNLYTQLNHQTFALEKREQEMREFMDITNDQDQYLWYNWQDRTLEIDWDAIDQITDEEQYKHVKELIDEAEEIQDKIDDADDSIMDITNQIQELENIWRDTFVDFEDRVLDAIIKSYQQIIDNYSELNDTLNNSNTQILDSLQKQISLERQIRDNTKTEEEISDEEARLAYLRRDTSGGNDLAALQLERELADQRESYEDTLVDQAISRLQEDNDAAAQQRERQIEIMQAQLDYQSENGEFNAYISELLTAAMGADGELLTNSDLVTLLKEQENWDAMSDVSKQVWDEELNGTFKEVAAFLLKENAEQNGTFYTALTEAVKSVSTSIGSYSQAMVKLGNSISSMGSSGGGYSGGGSEGAPSQSETLKPYTYENRISGQTVTISASSASAADKIIQRYSNSAAYKRYATGGLNTKTGLAWLDGTTSEPEYVLNARQTDAFLKLADVLPSMMNGTSTTTSNTFGSTYVNLSINLESVSPDYDVDRMVDLVKDKLYDAGSYRNVNSLSFLR